MTRPKANARQVAEMLAIQALTYLADDGERLGRFLAVSGIGPESLRAAAQDARFLAGVLDYVVGDEQLLIDFAKEVGVTPVDVQNARRVLGSGDWERDVP